MNRPSSLAAAAVLMLLPPWVAAGAEITAGRKSPTASQTYTVAPRPGVQHELQKLLIQAVPGDVLQLVEGVYHLDADLMVTTHNLTIRGKGPDKTILSFKNQRMGSKGLEATGDNFVIEDLAVEDTIGNAIKTLGCKGVTFRRVRTAWTGGPKPTNGAYGLYPVQCEDVLIEDCVAIGASDAGIYVGQSKNIVVRRSRAEYNVAGIEIENSIDADVYENTATNNTGGLLVFDLPGLQVANGHNTRVFHNKIYANNHKNFAPPGNIVGNVPPGTGVMVMATDHVEVFENEIADHGTTNVSLISYFITGKKFDPKNYDPISQSVSIHDNKISGGGKRPAGAMGRLLAPIMPTFPDILYDGVVDEKVTPARNAVPFLEKNGGATFANIHFLQITPENILAAKIKIDTDLSKYAGRLASLPEVRLKPHTPPGPANDAAVVAYREALPRLSDYKLFRGNGSTQEPAEGVVPYDLTTPLFSDYTAKHRFIRVPSGTSIAYRPDGVFEFPVGTVIAKTFASPPDSGNPPKKEQLLETRIIEKKEAGWFGYAYLWNEAQTDADLALGGSEVAVRWTHTDGKPRSNDYIVPHANQCKSCHVTGTSFEPIGLKARYLNREFAFPQGSENQLAHMSRIGVLHGAPSADKAPRAPAYDDPRSGTLEARARTWLDINCAHCHSATGPARTSGLDLRFDQADPSKVGVWKSPVAAGRGSGGRKYDIVPGKPDESILLYRLESTEPGIMMPELPRRLVPEEPTALIAEWVRQMRDSK